VLIQTRRYALILSAQRHEVYLCHTPALELWVQSSACRHALHLALILSVQRHEVHLCHAPPLEPWVQNHDRRYVLHLCLPPALELQVLTWACSRHALLLFARGLCAPCLWLCGCCWLVAKNHSLQLQYARAHVFRMLPVCVCVRVCGGVCMYVAGAL